MLISSEELYQSQSSALQEMFWKGIFMYLISFSVCLILSYYIVIGEP